MRNATRWLLLVPLLSLLWLAGCGLSKVEQAYALRSTFNAALAESIALHKAGVISDRAMVAAKPVVHELAAVLDDLDRVAVDENADGWAVIEDHAHQALQKFLTWLATSRAKH